mmetsp:Transcript_7425/g.20860  ORF Transcript_7425/g.20860 Transcript_7425/m.20860 type:complete len:357 (+) Transcript_7425:17-1087(+)
MVAPSSGCLTLASCLGSEPHHEQGPEDKAAPPETEIEISPETGEQAPTIFVVRALCTSPDADACLGDVGSVDLGSVDLESVEVTEKEQTEGSASAQMGRTMRSGKASLVRQAGGALVTLHIYDVWGYSAVKTMNKIVALFGTGAFHSAVEVFSTEYSYGYMDDPPGCTGVFCNEPGECEAHSYRENLVMGQTQLCEREVELLLMQLRDEWPGQEYDLLRKNCCHFSDELCRRLGVGSIPSWVNNLAAAGATLGDGFRQITKPKDRQRHSDRIVQMAKSGSFSPKYSFRGAVRAPGHALMTLMSEGVGERMKIASFLWEERAEEPEAEEVVQTPVKPKAAWLCCGRLCGGAKRPGGH